MTKPGIWRVECYQSGTVVVTEGKTAATKFGVRSVGPHLYVYGPHSRDESKRDRDRRAVAEDLAVFLNGGTRPKWLDDMERTTEDSAKGLGGTSIRATGPSVDTNPPNCFWKEDDSDDATNARARLMDRLFLVPSSQE